MSAARRTSPGCTAPPYQPLTIPATRHHGQVAHRLRDRPSMQVRASRGERAPAVGATCQGDRRRAMIEAPAERLAGHAEIRPINRTTRRPAEAVNADPDVDHGAGNVHAIDPSGQSQPEIPVLGGAAVRIESTKRAKP